MNHAIPLLGAHAERCCRAPRRHWPRRRTVHQCCARCACNAVAHAADPPDRRQGRSPSRPNARTSCGHCSTASARRDGAAPSRSRRAQRSAIARPMPRLAPVTRTVSLMATPSHRCPRPPAARAPWECARLPERSTAASRQETHRDPGSCRHACSAARIEVRGSRR